MVDENTEKGGEHVHDWHGPSYDLKCDCGATGRAHTAMYSDKESRHEAADTHTGEANDEELAKLDKAIDADVQGAK